MEWAPVLSYVAANGLLILWFAREGRITRDQSKRNNFVTKDEIRKEIRDLHGRICALEERTRSDRSQTK